MDFTFKTYENLLNSLLSRGFLFYTYDQYVEAEAEAEVEADENYSQSHSNSTTTVHRSPFNVHTKLITYYKFQSLESFES